MILSALSENFRISSHQSVSIDWYIALGVPINPKNQPINFAEGRSHLPKTLSRLAQFGTNLFTLFN